VVLVAEEHMAVVRVDGAGKVLLVHLRAREAVLGIVDDGIGRSHKREASVTARENGSVTDSGSE